MKKKSLAFLLAFIMLLAVTPMALSADIPSGWAREQVEEAIAIGFVPDDLQRDYQSSITRQDYCRMAVRWLAYALEADIDSILLANGVSRPPSTYFRDTSDPDILAAVALGIVAGTVAPTPTQPGTFAPNNNLTRQEAATLMMRIASVIGASTTAPASGFSDAPTPATHWANAGINYCKAAGIIAGVGNNRFDPLGLFTREQAIVMMQRVDPQTLYGLPLVTPTLSTATIPRKKTAAENPQNYSITNMHREACYPLSVWAGYRIPDGPGECMGLWVGSSASPNAAYTGSTGYLNVYDGKINTGLTNGNAGIKMDEKWILMEVRMLHSNSSANQRATIEGSNNGSAWVTLWDGTIPTSTLDFKAASGLSAFVNNTGYTQFRYTTAGTVYELEWWGYKAPTQTSWPAPIAPPSSVSVLERTAWELVNTERAKYGLRPADWNTTLASAARVEATYNRNRGSLMHRINGYVNGFNGMAFDYLIMGRTTAATAVNGFLDSETHRGAIYTGTNIGIGQDGGFWCFINGTPGT